MQSTGIPTSPPSRFGRWGILLLWLMPVLALVLVLGYAFLSREQATDTAPQAGKVLADFTLPDLQGRQVQLSALRGQVVFINVWTTWCQPCVEEMPTIEKLHGLMAPRGLRILAVNMDALGEQVVRPFVAKYRLTFPVLLDPKSRIERLYATKGVPESFLVDKRGVLVEKVVGPRDWAHPQVVAMFERLLAM